MATIDNDTASKWRKNERIGICLGSEAARPNLEYVAKQIKEQLLPSKEEIELLSPQAPADLVADMFRVTGPVSVISTACTSSSQAIGEGVFRIRRGEVDTMIVGGVDVLVDPIMVTGFSRLGALSTRNDAPDKARVPLIKSRWFCFRESAGMLILELKRRL